MIAGDLVEQGGVVPGQCRAHRRDDEHGQPFEPTHEIGEESQRCPIAPVEVVDGEQQRPVRGEVDDHPVEPVHGGERRVGAVVSVGSQVEDGAGSSGGTGEEDVLTAHQYRLDQLAHHAEGELPLELAASGAQNPQPGGTGVTLRLAQQA